MLVFKQILHARSEKQHAQYARYRQLPPLLFLQHSGGFSQPAPGIFSTSDKCGAAVPDRPAACGNGPKQRVTVIGRHGVNGNVMLFSFLIHEVRDGAGADTDTSISVFLLLRSWSSFTAVSTPPYYPSFSFSTPLPCPPNISSRSPPISFSVFLFSFYPPL